MRRLYKKGSSIICTEKPYTYKIMTDNINRLKQKYPFLNIESIGKSVLEKDIYAISVGYGKNEVLYNGAHHACEWITSLLLMKFLETFCQRLVKGKSIYNYNLLKICNQSTIRIVPMVNPDGVNLEIKGLTKENKKFHDNLIKWNNGNNDFTYWSSNIRGVDLNHNYDAGWYAYKEREAEYGIYGPGPTRYSGENPVSEPETEALVKYTRKHEFKLVLAYHSQGKIIYWDYANKSPKNSIKIAKKFSKRSGYEIEAIAEGAASSGGYKDWFIDEFNRPGFTIEAGIGKNPLPLSQLDEIYTDNIRILLSAALV